jgi:phosphate transport system substrate-binding protein
MTRRRIILNLSFAALFCLAALGGWAMADEPKSAPDREEALAIVVNKKNPLENVTFEDLRKLCLGERKFWSDGHKVTIVLREPEQAERNAVLTQVYRMNENEFRRYFLQSSFTGEVQSTPKELATVNGVRRFVFNVPGAIGFVRVCDVDDSVKVITLDGHKPGDPHYKLKLPAQ